MVSSEFSQISIATANAQSVFWLCECEWREAKLCLNTSHQLNIYKPYLLQWYLQCFSSWNFTSQNLCQVA